MKNKWGRRIGIFALASIASVCTININGIAASAANNTWQFNYIENVQEWTVPYSGNYKIEGYGGKGADYADKKGGKGGKVTSTYTFEQGDVLKIYTGGNGNNPSGGWGNIAGSHTGNQGNDGGGATEIYVTRDGSTTRLMVAGGGGGANRDFDGGAGGSVIPGSGNSGGGGGGYNSGRNGNLVNADIPYLVFTPPKNADGTYKYTRRGPYQPDSTDSRNWTIGSTRTGGYTHYDNAPGYHEYWENLTAYTQYNRGGAIEMHSGFFDVGNAAAIQYYVTWDVADKGMEIVDTNIGQIPRDLEPDWDPIDTVRSYVQLIDQNGNELEKITIQDIKNGISGGQAYYHLNTGLTTGSDVYIHDDYGLTHNYIMKDSSVTKVALILRLQYASNSPDKNQGMNTGIQINGFYGSWDGHPSSGGSNFIDGGFSAKDYSSEHGVNDGNGYVKIESLHAHHYTSQITTAATCTTTGVRTHTCTGTATDPGCGDQYTEVIPALGHAYPADYSYSDSNGITNGLAYKNCTRCGTRLDSKWLNRIRVRYQNADGTFSGYTNVVNGYYYSGSNISWGRNADASYQYAGTSWTSTTAAKSVDITVYRNVYYVDYAKGLTNNGGATGRTSHLYGSNVRLAGNGFEGRTYHLYFNANKPNNALGQVTSSRLSSLPGTQSGKLTFAYWGVQATYNGGNYRANTDLGAKNFEPANRTARATAVWNNKVLSWGNPTLEGYTFTGWYYLDNSRANNSLTVTSAASAYNNTVYAHWRANTDTPYTVRHWIQKVTDCFKPDSDPKEYELVDTEYLVGTTDTLVTPPTKPLTGKYAGCIAPALQSKILSGDGSMVIDYYYDRTKVTLDINGEYLIKQYVDQLDSETQKKYYSNLGMSSTDTNNNMGTFDMYINNILVADDVRDYYNDQILYGSTWEIRDIKPDAGKHYYGSEVN